VLAIVLSIGSFHAVIGQMRRFNAVLMAALSCFAFNSVVKAQTAPPLPAPGLVIQGSTWAYTANSADTPSINDTSTSPFSESLSASTPISTANFSASASYGNLSASASGSSGSVYGASSSVFSGVGDSYAGLGLLADESPGAAYSDTITIQSATLAPGTPVQVSFTEIMRNLNFSYSAVPGGNGGLTGITELAYIDTSSFNYGLDGVPPGAAELHFPAIGQTEYYSGYDAIGYTLTDTSYGFSETITSTIDVGDTLEFGAGILVYGAAVEGVNGQYMPYDFSVGEQATTLINVLTPGADYTTGSGTDYATSESSVPDGGLTAAMLGTAWGALVWMRRKLSKKGINP
jgi:hypothetical protein